MAPCRQLLLWSVPSLAVLLGIYWFRKKKELAGSDPGGKERLKCLQEELAEALRAEVEGYKNLRAPSVERVLAKSAPIDIIPNGSSSQKSSPLELTEEEIEKEIDELIRKKSLEKSKNQSFTSPFKESEKFDTSLDSVNMTSTVLTCSQSVTNGPKGSSPNDSRSLPHISSEDSTKSSQTVPKNLGKIYLDKEELTTRIMTDDVADRSDGASVADVKNVNYKENSSNVDNVQEINDSSLSSCTKCPTEEIRCISERDSANHSPVDPMLASPSMCHFSDNHSEGSSDSGKGCSEAASPPPANMSLAQSDVGLRIYQFLIPQALVGMLIGKHGAFVMQVKAKTGANVVVKKHPESIKYKVCVVEGTQNEIDAALDMIRNKFPDKRFPNLTLQEVSAELFQNLIPLVPEFLQLQLVESVNNETIITCLVNAGHFFLQQPLHPTFPSLHALHKMMSITYQNPDVPPMPQPIKEGSICAAPTENNWYRAQVISTSQENGTSVVKLVDFGGYLTLDSSQLKQIRSDFMTLPFQATEALLAYVKPAKNAEEWSAEALRIMAGLTAGQMVHAQVAGYDESGLPYVNLYLTIASQQVLFLNGELVQRGLADWDVPTET